MQKKSVQFQTLITRANINLKRRNRYQYKGNHCKFYGSLKFILEMITFFSNARFNSASETLDRALQGGAVHFIDNPLHEGLQLLNRGWLSSEHLFFNKSPEKKNPMGISPVTEEARGSSIGGKSVFQENGSGATPWLRWRCVPSPHPAGTTHPVNSIRESLLPAWQHRFHWKWGRPVRFQETQKNRGHKFYASSFHTKLLFLANEGASRKNFEAFLEANF